MSILKRAGAGLLGAAGGVGAFIFVNAFVGVAATGPGGIGAVSTGLGPLLAAALVGFVLGFGWMQWRQSA